jgi:hypothetical protein
MNIRAIAALGILFVAARIIADQGRGDEVNAPPARGERHQDSLKVGDPAPDFTLPDPQGTRQVTLSTFRGKKPVVLVFGSYT